MDMVSFRAMIPTFLLQNVCTKDACIKISQLRKTYLEVRIMYGV